MTNVRLTHSDAVVAGQSMSFAILCAAVIQVCAGCAWWEQGAPAVR